MSVLNPAIERSIWRKEMKQIPLQRPLFGYTSEGNSVPAAAIALEEKNILQQGRGRERLMESLNKHGFFCSKERRNEALV